MPDWLALSDLPPVSGTPERLHRGLFVCEVALPLAPHTLLLDWQPPGISARTLSLFLDERMGLVLLHRQGDQVTRKHLPGPLSTDQGTARILYGWNALADRWFLSFSRLGTGLEARADGRRPIVPDMADLGEICRSDGVGLRHPALLWFGVTQGNEPPEQAPWIGLQTPIETARGPVAAGNLRPGDMVLTADNGLQPILRVNRLRLPSRGSFAPIILRAPFLRQGSDILAAAGQLLVLHGPEVEYMFGAEEVLIPAEALADGRIARRDTLRAATDGVAIDLGLPELLLADGLKLLSHGLPNLPPRQILHPWEAQQLVSLMGRRSRHGASLTRAMT
ncbi:MAG: Hint domain-containing protein [Cypionkella sp.]|jgi:hypothetical protein|nr:Hint domain-containing protein [Cypionkella sp.]